MLADHFLYGDHLFPPSLLEKGRMFVFSTGHLASLLPPSLPPASLALDIGSGDGHVTDKLREYLGPRATVHVTEASSVMRRVLKRKGYKLDMAHCVRLPP